CNLQTTTFDYTGKLTPVTPDALLEYLQFSSDSFARKSGVSIRVCCLLTVAVLAPRRDAMNVSGAIFPPALQSSVRNTELFPLCSHTFPTGSTPLSLCIDGLCNAARTEKCPPNICLLIRERGAELRQFRCFGALDQPRYPAQRSLDHCPFDVFARCR